MVRFFLLLSKKYQFRRSSTPVSHIIKYIMNQGDNHLWVLKRGREKSGNEKISKEQDYGI